MVRRLHGLAGMGELSTTAVIVTYRSRSTVGATLRAAQEAHEAGLLDCIVVDNASDDGTAELVASEHPWVTLIESPRNLGFARACNLGVREVRSRYVLFLNPDAVLPLDALGRMVRLLETRPRAGIVAPAIREPDSQLQEAGGLPTPLGMVLQALGAPNVYPERRPIVPGEPAFQTDWLCGAILLVRRILLERIGGFDPRFFLYFEETDLCKRALERGWEIWAVGRAVAEHVNAVSAETTRALMFDGCIAEHYFRSRYYYMVKHYGWFRATGAELGELGAMAARDMARRLLFRPRGAPGVRLLSPILSRPSAES
jgi:GT2 family glycosyltransferase